MANDMIAELDGQLASLNQLKPPGASKTKISAITQLCVANVQAESSIVQSLYRALKKAPSTHKLGALYVIDSVVRQWIEKAKHGGQDVHAGGRGDPGTYGAAVKRVTELMPALFEDIVKAIPTEQKPKLDNVINIWDKGGTFPSTMLGEFRGRVVASSSTISAATVSHEAQPGVKFMAPIPSRPVHTPLGFPPQQVYDHGLLRPAGEVSGQHAPSLISQRVSGPAATPSADVNSILAALANAVPKAPAIPTRSTIQQEYTPGSQGPAVQSLPMEIAALLGQQQQQLQTQQQPNYTVPLQQAVQWPTAAKMPNPVQHQNAFNPQIASSALQQQHGAAFAAQYAPPVNVPDPLAPIRALLPANILQDQAKLMQALGLLQDLQNQGIAMSEWGPILKAFAESTPTQQIQHPPMRDRDRSRSPDRGRYGSRNSPTHGVHTNGKEPAFQQYRQRSPGRESQGNGAMAMNGMPMQPKYIAHDPKLAPDSIKVLSRTLFVGGANGSQQEIQRLFERFGHVQTCIANRDKRHAFVKMSTRNYALAAKQGMEELQQRNDREVMAIARQTKWGVGFGPRECCDYQKGESIIPIHKLTDADVKWLLSAEYGGTGGKKIEGGMVLEEPDIEIGAGVSSKAMSRRVGPDHGHTPSNGYNVTSNSNDSYVQQAKRPPRKDERISRHGGRGRDFDGGFGGGGGVGTGQDQTGMESYYPRPEPVAVATPPAVPNFNNFGFMLPRPQNYP